MRIHRCRESSRVIDMKKRLTSPQAFHRSARSNKGNAIVYSRCSFPSTYKRDIYKRDMKKVYSKAPMYVFVRVCVIYLCTCSTHLVFLQSVVKLWQRESRSRENLSFLLTERQIRTTKVLPGHVRECK